MMNDHNRLAALCKRLDNFFWLFLCTRLTPFYSGKALVVRWCAGASDVFHRFHCGGCLRCQRPKP